MDELDKAPGDEGGARVSLWRGDARLAEGAALNMAREAVQVIGPSCAPTPDAVWAVARDFCGAWHPGHRDDRAPSAAPRGALIRAFTVQGEDTLYREQLTYRSRQRPDAGLHPS